MDYGLTPSEMELFAGIGQVVASHGGTQKLLQSAGGGGFDADLDAAVADTVPPEASLLERALVVEECARLGLPVLPGPRLLVGWEALGGPPSLPVAVVDRRRPGPARVAPIDCLLVGLDSASAWIAELQGEAVAPVTSSFGYPFGEVGAREGEPVSAGRAARVLSVVRLALACEIAGTARAAIDHVATYLDRRQQFGRRLSSFQALRHRIAELEVSTEAAIWLARQAAWHDDPERTGSAVIYARDLAARMAPEIVQLSGARGFTIDFPAHLFAMRLEGLRLILGSPDRVSEEVMAASRPQGEEYR